MTMEDPTAEKVLGEEAATKTIEAWRLTTAHVLVVHGRRVPLAATDTGSDDYGRHVVLAQPADGGRPYRFDTREEVTVAVASKGPIFDGNAKAALLRGFSYLEDDGTDEAYATAAMEALDPIVASLLSAAREAGREEGRREAATQIAHQLMEARWLADSFAPWAQAAKIARGEADYK